MSSLALALVDGAVVAKRNLIKIKRVPEVLIWTTMSPIMFVLLFAYVFGGSIEIPGTSYKEYLMAGIFAQTVIFGSTFTGARPGGGHDQGDHRPIQVPAYLQVRRAHRPHRE